jgi:hypothetical protein
MEPNTSFPSPQRAAIEPIPGHWSPVLSDITWHKNLSAFLVVMRPAQREAEATSVDAPYSVYLRLPKITRWSLHNLRMRHITMIKDLLNMGNIL